MKRSPLALAYRVGTQILEHAAMPFLRWRVKRGKEDPNRLPERLGLTERQRPEGPLAWVHGASVGEALAVLPFIEKLAARGFRILLTTGTVSSSRVLGGRLPSHVIHQFVPIDGPRAARLFIDHWQPNLVCFAESELWPNLISEARRRSVPILLVNARMSERSFARWQRLPAMIGPLLGMFDLILAQTEEDAFRLSRLGAPQVLRTGNLKFDVKPPPADAAEVLAFSACIGSRPVWVAASTHAGEEAICCEVHRSLKERFPDLLTIIVPRKADRGPAIAAEAEALGLATRLRSRQQSVVASTHLYVADTMGDLGLFFRLAGIVFVGKSLTGGGGQNPIEPAKLGAAILHGPDVANFAEVYATFDRMGGAIEVGTGEALANSVGALLADAAMLRRTARQAVLAVEECAGATARTMQAIEPFCDAVLRGFAR